MANNVDVIGDRKTFEQILFNDFTETNGVLEDDVITSLGNRKLAYLSSMTKCILKNVKRMSNGIPQSMFESCGNLKEIHFPKWVDGFGQNFAANCSSLTYADAGNTSGIATYAFYKCGNLVTLILRNTSKITTLNATGAFTNTKYATNGAGGAYVYVPRDLISTYQTATNWATLYAAHSDMFRALEDYTVDGTTTGEFDESKL